jgi:hypothetical protein
MTKKMFPTSRRRIMQWKHPSRGYYSVQQTFSHYVSMKAGMWNCDLFIFVEPYKLKCKGKDGMPMIISFLYYCITIRPYSMKIVIALLRR